MPTYKREHRQRMRYYFWKVVIRRAHSVPVNINNLFDNITAHVFTFIFVCCVCVCCFVFFRLVLPLSCTVSFGAFCGSSLLFCHRIYFMHFWYELFLLFCVGAFFLSLSLSRFFLQQKASPLRNHQKSTYAIACFVGFIEGCRFGQTLTIHVFHILHCVQNNRPNDWPQIIIIFARSKYMCL